MNCSSCGTQIPASFGHAIKKNECPACGSILMDEKSMAFIEELRNFTLKTVNISEEMADMLSLALVATYNISVREGVVQPKGIKKVKKTGPTVQRKDDDEEAGDGGIVKASDLFDPDNPISPEERNEILQERIETRLIAQNMTPSKYAARIGQYGSISDSELAESPILEAQRLKRLQEQEANELAGVSKIRRSQ